MASVQHAGGAINWSQVATDKYKFVFIKSTEGSYYANPYYGSDAVAAKAAGLIVAPYAFAIPNYTGGAFQADYALDHSGYAADGHTLPPIIDLENDPYDQPVKNGGRHQRVLRPQPGSDGRVDLRLRRRDTPPDWRVPGHLHDRCLVEDLHRRQHRIRGGSAVGR